MTITNPSILKLKGILFLLLAATSASLLLFEAPNLRTLLLLGVLVWAACRFYYFAFYVLHHYADKEFQYSGLTDLLKYLLRRKK